ncbi:MAG: acyl-ACP desaturase [Verrucomicrobiales bacterium]
MNPKKQEVIAGMEGFVSSQLEYLQPVEGSWQPQDWLPDMTSEDWVERVQAFREPATGLSDAVLVVLVGDMVTEEALPTYQTLLNGYEGISDKTGTDPSSWAQWTRGWTAEENRHGDLLNKYLYLTGRVDMRAVELTIQNLLRNGFDPGTAQDPYKGFVYTSFQERATKISHKNVAQLARAEGDESLQGICSAIASDEARHEKVYTNFMSHIFEQDPNGSVLAFRDLMRDQVVMPSHLMQDGSGPDLFEHFSAVAQQLGVYTAKHYGDIVEHLVRSWDVEHLTGLNGEAAEAQDYLCRLGARYAKLAERSQRRQSKIEPRQFSWIFNRAV